MKYAFYIKTAVKLALLYLLFAYLNWDWSLGQWTGFTRLCFLIAAITAIIYDENRN